MTTLELTLRGLGALGLGYLCACAIGLLYRRYTKK